MSYLELIYLISRVKGLMSAESKINDTALQELSTRYGVDILTPTTAFFAAARAMIAAYKAFLAEALHSRRLDSESPKDHMWQIELAEVLKGTHD
jgi:hypothetical protein